MVDDLETIRNVIVASPEVAATYLVANGGDYDYVIDMASIEQSPDIGWSYDPGENLFSPPPTPPEDFEAELETALGNIVDAIGMAADAYWAANSSERTMAVGDVTDSLSVNAPEDIQAIMAGIIAHIEGL